MKNVCVLLFLLPLFGFAQKPHAILNSFTAYKQANGVLLRWVIEGGNQCNGTMVFRRNAEGNFESINHISGICGSSTENETYQYFDAEPFSNEYNYYKLGLGFQGFSDSITVFYEDFGNANHKVFSDFQNNTQRIIFSNDLNRKAVLEVYDQTGRGIFSETATDSDFLVRPSFGWLPGIYIFRITGVSEKDIRGKLYFGSR